MIQLLIHLVLGLLVYHVIIMYKFVNVHHHLINMVNLIYVNLVQIKLLKQHQNHYIVFDMFVLVLYHHHHHRMQHVFFIQVLYLKLFRINQLVILFNGQKINNINLLFDNVVQFPMIEYQQQLLVIVVNIYPLVILMVVLEYMKQIV